MPFLIDIHYAKRVPSITYSFGLIDDWNVIGVATFGTPSSGPLREGICGAKWSSNVLELNRLCLKYNRKNEASFLTMGAIKKLPLPSIIVSYADTDQKHIGTVYQACNFIYTGLSAKRTDWAVIGQEHLHGQTIADEFRGKDGRRSELMREKYGNDFYLKERSRKHRYLYFHGNKTQKKDMKRDLKYSTKPYPKGKTT